MRHWLICFAIALGIATARGDGLLEAIVKDDRAAVAELIKNGSSVSGPNDFGALPLHLACQNGNHEIVALLLDSGADANQVQAGGETPLMAAARNGDTSCVTILIDRGAELDAKERRGQTAIMWAAAEGHKGVVQLLLSAGADIESPLKSGFTPLLFAIRQGHPDVARSLIVAGADVNRAARPDRTNGRSMRMGTSPLILAIENGHFQLAAQLLEAGADPNDQRTGFTPLHTLTWVRKTVRGDGDDGIPVPEGSGDLNSLDLARNLVKAGADVNARLKNGRGGRGKVHRKGATPFLLAAETADVPYLKVLHELGADPEIGNVANSMPIHAAAGLGVVAPGEEAGRLPEAMEAIVYLLELGADINAVDNDGETAMHCAAYKCEPEMIRLLDKRGADINLWNNKNKGGWTPLNIAQGHRPGNFRPIAEVEAAMSEVMRAHGIEPPAAPERVKKKGY